MFRPRCCENRAVTSDDIETIERATLAAVAPEAREEISGWLLPFDFAPWAAPRARCRWPTRRPIHDRCARSRSVTPRAAGPPSCAFPARRRSTACGRRWRAAATPRPSRPRCTRHHLRRPAGLHRLTGRHRLAARRGLGRGVPGRRVRSGRPRQPCQDLEPRSGDAVCQPEAGRPHGRGRRGGVRPWLGQCARHAHGAGLPRPRPGRPRAGVAGRRRVVARIPRMFLQVEANNPPAQASTGAPGSNRRGPIPIGGNEAYRHRCLFGRGRRPLLPHNLRGRGGALGEHEHPEIPALFLARPLHGCLRAATGGRGRVDDLLGPQAGSRRRGFPYLPG